MFSKGHRDGRGFKLDFAQVKKTNGRMTRGVVPIEKKKKKSQVVLDKSVVYNQHLVQQCCNTADPTGMCQFNGITGKTKQL